MNWDFKKVDRSVWVPMILDMLVVFGTYHSTTLLKRLSIFITHIATVLASYYWGKTKDV